MILDVFLWFYFSTLLIVFVDVLQYSSEEWHNKLGTVDVFVVKRYTARKRSVFDHEIEILKNIYLYYCLQSINGFCIIL